MLDMHCRPSELLEIEDAYTAFRFDEACALILKRMQDGEEPRIRKNVVEAKNYSRPSDFYKNFD